MSTILNSVPSAPRVVATNEKVTGPPAAELLRRSGLTFKNQNEITVLDNATAGGVLVAEIFQLVRQASTNVVISRVVAGDVDDMMLGYIRRRKDDSLGDESTWGSVEIMKVDQQSIPLPDDTFDYVFSNFGVFFCKDDEAALKASLAIPALSTFIPEAPALPTPSDLFPSRGWNDPIAIPAKLERAGFQEVQVDEYSFTPDVLPEEFAEATGVLVKVGTSKIWSPEDNAKYADRIQPALLRYLLENFPQGKWNGRMTAVLTLAKKA